MVFILIKKRCGEFINQLWLKPIGIIIFVIPQLKLGGHSAGLLNQLPSTLVGGMLNYLIQLALAKMVSVHEF